LDAALLASLTADSQRLFGVGEVSARGASASLALGWGTRWGQLRAYVGPALRVTLERGSAHGLPENFEGSRGLCSAGADGGMIWAAAEHATVGAALAFDTPIGNGEFVIDRQEVLRPARLRGWLGVGLGYAF
jgi:hypothetical protein